MIEKRKRDEKKKKWIRRKEVGDKKRFYSNRSQRGRGIQKD